MLTRRLGLLVAASLMAALVAFGALVDLAFVRQQRTQQDALLERELARVTTLVQRSQLDTAFLDEGVGMTLQFVGAGGEVRIPPTDDAPLPYHEAPTRVRHTDGLPFLVLGGPWRLPSGREVGTVRLGVNLSGVAAARATLWRVLVAVGASIALVAGAVTLWSLRRALAPLERLVREAEAIDPADPQRIALPWGRAHDDEVGRLARVLDRALEGIRAHRRRERDALAEVAHELAAPLSVVAARLAALEGRVDDPGVRAAREAADELLHTSRDLLTLARGELEQRLPMEAVDLAGVVRSVAAETPAVRVEAAGSVEVLGSPDRLRQLVRNLIRNALQASEKGGVEVRAFEDEDEAVLEVLDRGPGVPRGEEERIFSRHVSGRRGGTGLGLSVARRIAEAHDATLAAAPRDGGGAAFTLRMPGLASRFTAEPYP